MAKKRSIKRKTAAKGRKTAKKAPRAARRATGARLARPTEGIEKLEAEEELEEGAFGPARQGPYAPQSESF